MDKPKEVKIEIQNGDSFHADEIGMIYNPIRFILDFKSVTPRIDMRNKEFQPIVLKHNVVVIDPFMAKSLHEMLGANIKNFEKRFGKIKKPTAIEKLEKENTKIKPEKKDSPSYFG